MPPSRGFIRFSESRHERHEEPLVKLADVIKPAEKPKPLPPDPPVEAETETASGVIWSYKKEQPKPKPPEEYTPGFDFSEKVEVDGKERKVELSASGLYLFDSREKFEKPKPRPPVTPSPTGVWVGMKRPMSDGKVLIPLQTEFKKVTVRGRGIREILNLTKKTK